MSLKEVGTLCIKEFTNRSLVFLLEELLPLAENSLNTLACLSFPKLLHELDSIVFAFTVFSQTVNLGLNDSFLKRLRLQFLTNHRPFFPICRSLLIN